MQSVRLGPQGTPQNGTSLRVEVNCSRIRMLGRANTARFDFNIQLGMGTCGHDTSTNLASDCSYMSRNMVQMEGLRTVSPFAHRLHVAKHVPRILSVGVFFHGLF